MPSGTPATALAITGLVAISLALRLEGLGSWLWMDEGISVGIASHPFLRIPGLLAQDGSPPLYYLVLHGWMALVGSSETQTHALSLVFAVAAVPAGLWAGWTLFGRKAGWIVAILMATSPYLGFFATETRMYSLVVLLSLLATAAYLHVFVYGRGRYQALFVVSLVLLLYTHNWGLYLAAAAVLGLVPCAMAAQDRPRLPRRAAMSFGAVLLLYLPWVPTLVTQARRTGAPWSPTPTVRETVSILGEVLGDTNERVLVALVLTAGVAVATMIRRRSTEGAAAAALVVLVAVTLGLGWGAAQVKPAWSPRYLGVLFPPLVLLAGLGLARFAKQGMVALALVVLFWTQPFGRLTGEREALRPANKSADRDIAEVVRSRLRPGDLVLATQMEEVPVLRYYLGPELRYADPTGVVANPRIVDWREASARMAAARPEAVLPAVDALAPGGHLLVVCPTTPTTPDVEWYVLMQDRCADWKAVVSNSPVLRPVPDNGLKSFDEGGQRFLGLYEKVVS